MQTGVRDEARDGNTDGDEIEQLDPPPEVQTPLPHWLLNALRPTSATATKAGVVPRSAHVLEHGCARDKPDPPPPKPHDGCLDFS